MAVLHEKFDWGSDNVWWVGLPKFIDLAKIGLANGQPGSITKSVASASPGVNSQKMAFVLTSPRITVS